MPARDLAHHDPLLFLQLVILAAELVHRKHRVVGRVVGVVHGRAVDRAVVLPHRQEIGDRDRLAVRDQEAVEVPRLRRPGAHPRRAARLRQEDRALAPEVVLAPVAREVPLVRAPAELGRLAAFAHEAVHRPGVDELARHFRPVRNLGVALGDVDHLDAECLRRGSPSRRGSSGRRLRGRCPAAMSSSACFTKCETRPGLAPCVMTAVGPLRPALAQLEHFLPQRVVRAPARRDVRVRVTARPRLDAGVEVQRALLVAELDERDAGDVDRQVQHEVAAADERLEHVPVVLAGERVIDELDAELGPPLRGPRRRR